MTWSIVARDPSGALGVVVASRFFAVGALCPYAHSGVGALSTQALFNPLYGPRGLALLSQGIAPNDVVRSLVADDPGREHRQFHLVDAEGKVAAHTGIQCLEWSGQLAGDGFSVAGNMLAGPQVIEATARVYDAGRDLPFAERLMAAMTTGEAACPFFFRFSISLAAWARRLATETYGLNEYHMEIPFPKEYEAF